MTDDLNADPLLSLRKWFHPRILDTSEDHAKDQFLFSNAIDAANIEPWIEGPFLRFSVDDFTPAQADELYGIVHKLYKSDLPTILLAKQPPTYPLFFDIDIKGTLNPDSVDETLDLLQLEKLTLFRNLAKAIQEIYADEFMRMVIYESHGISIPLSEGFKDSSYGKASFHVVFPDIIVDRTDNCLVRASDGGHNKVPMKRHVKIMDHVRFYLDKSQDPDLKEFLEHLKRLENSDWTEIFDENPLWHERWDDMTGMRLCYTKKKGEAMSRVKVPWKAFRVIGDDFVEFTEEVSMLEWSQWGNVLDPRGIREVSPWREENLRQYATEECQCRLCYYDTKYQPSQTAGWETGWEKSRDPASKEVFFWHEEKQEGFWQEDPAPWQRFMHPQRGYFFWQNGTRYFWDP